VIEDLEHVLASTTLLGVRRIISPLGSAENPWALAAVQGNTPVTKL